MGKEHRQDWDRYWHGAGDLPVFAQFTTNAGTLQAFWSEFFTGALAGGERTRLLDMACGSGAVAAIALEVAEGRSGITCVPLDYSANAVSDLRRRLPQLLPVASDSRAAPFAAGAFDVIVSQFGLEYAGPPAFAEAARLLAPSGVFCALCHLDSGPIHRECRDNLETIETVLGCDFLALAKSAFSAQSALNRGEGSAQAAEEAHGAFAEAADRLAKLVDEKGMSVANGTPARLHRDVMYMYRRRRNFEPREVLDWIEGMTGEITAYAGRMRAMTAAALDDAAIREIHQSLTAAGLQAEEPARLGMGSAAEPGAWILKAAR